MQIQSFSDYPIADVANLFDTVFTVSEGEEEGRLISRLVEELVATTAADDLVGLVAVGDSSVIASIFFSRLFFDTDDSVFILSPVAVHSSHQGKGVGTAIINEGLEKLRTEGVSCVFTYGDPAYYGRFGFQSISEDVVKAPLKLTYPQGWLACSLSEGGLGELRGTARCVEALNNQVYW